MIEVRYELLNNECFNNYLKFLIGSIYKILPIQENEPDTLLPYLESLKIELIGNLELIEKIRYDGGFLRLLGTIQYLISHECTHKEIRREVFKTIKIIERLQEKYGLKEGDNI
jgi:hypothetical protein